MTNTDTADADATAIQVARLAHAGSQLVRVTVNTEAAAAAVPEMVRKVRGLGVDVPIVGDFHYNGHKLLTEYPETARAPGQVPDQPGQRRRQAPRRALRDDRQGRDRQRQDGPHRGQLGLARPGDPDRADGRQRPRRRATRRARRDDRRDARVGAALGRAGRGDRDAPRPDHPVGQGLRRPRPRRRLPAAGRAQRLPAAPRPDRGGDGRQGRHRLDGRPLDPAQRGYRRHDPRLADARARCAARARGRDRPAGPPVDGPALVPAPGLGLPRLRPHDLARSSRRWPSRSRATSRSACRSGARPIRARRRCASRSWAASSTGPGESKHADIGISLPGTFEEPVAPVFIDGRLDRTLRGDGLVAEFIEILEDYVEQRYPTPEPATPV